ncbi:MAG: hypothetical protein V2J24_12980 [Pseudomonadales bacterium]|nr:hypothetical protein [Pseudomonadales bacterium]
MLRSAGFRRLMDADRDTRARIDPVARQGLATGPAAIAPEQDEH